MPNDTASASAVSVSPLKMTREGPIVIATLDRSAARNSLSEGLMAALQAMFDDVREDRTASVIVLTANGPAFSAGHDLKEMTARRADPDRGRAYYREMMARCAKLMQSVVMSPKPVIAAVQGIASAAGCQLVASCDLAVASATARFATPGVNIGLFCSTPMVALSRNIPRKRAMEMLLLGEMLDAESAATYGLVNRVVAPERLMDETMAMARLVASKSPATIAIGKEAFYRQDEMKLDEAYRYAAEVMVENMLYRDAEEGINAFIEKRPATWHGC